MYTKWKSNNNVSFIVLKFAQEAEAAARDSQVSVDIVQVVSVGIVVVRMYPRSCMALLL